MEIDSSGELTSYDNLHAHSRRGGLVGPLPGSAPAHHPVHPAFKLTRSAAAYWRAVRRTRSCSASTATAWESQEALDQHLERLAEAERRDHRKLGAELDLFSFPDEIGSGLAVFHPRAASSAASWRTTPPAARGSRLRVRQHPHITKGHLFEISGHLDWYADGMYPPMHLDEEYNADGSVRRQGQDYYLKPMNCPMHNLIFDARGRSYRELPLRLFEFARCTATRSPASCTG